MRQSRKNPWNIYKRVGHKGGTEQVDKLAIMTRALPEVFRAK